MAPTGEQCGSHDGSPPRPFAKLRLSGTDLFLPNLEHRLSEIAYCLRGRFPLSNRQVVHIEGWIFPYDDFESGDRQILLPEQDVSNADVLHCTRSFIALECIGIQKTV